MGINYARPNNHRKIPNVLSKTQLLKIFSNIEEIDVFVACLIALFCGLRISEVCKLKKQDVDLENEKVLIRQSKHDRDRVVMLPKSIIPLIEKWLHLNKESEYLIADNKGQQFLKVTLSKKFRQTLKKADLLIDTYKDSNGLQRHAYSFHTLRHTYATYLLEQGVDLYYVQRSLGHVDIHTTQIYAYISNKDLQQILRLETKIWSCQVTSIYDMANFIRFGFVFIAKDKTKIVGAILAIKTKDDEIFVEDLIVDKKYQNQGIGTKLKLKLISSVKLPMIGFVSPKFKASLKLQKKLGFKLVKKVKNPYMRNKKEYVFMFRKGV